MVELDYASRARITSYQIRSYFYGPSLLPPDWLLHNDMGGEAAGALETTLSPYSVNVKFGELKIFRIGAGTTKSFLSDDRARAC